MKTFKNKISGDLIQIAEQDFPENMTYTNAKAACKQLGNGWRLPSKYEWEEMVAIIFPENNKIKVSQFYWSSSFFLSDESNAFAFDIRGRQVMLKDSSKELKVRAVKVVSN